MKNLFSLLVLFLLPPAACTEVAHSLKTPGAAEQHGEKHQRTQVTPYSQCQSFEILDFGAFEAQALRGTAWSGSEPPQPLRGVRLVARATETGEVQSAVTSADGTFDFQDLANGEYAVSACLEGFDELQFRVEIRPETPMAHFELFLGASEALGRRDVVAVEGRSNG